MRPISPDSKIRRNLSKRWYNMQARCNDPKHPRFKDYGGAGVSIDQRWADRERFIEDAKLLPGYDSNRLLTGELHLDKDSRCPNSKVYSPETCTFVTIDVNNRFKPAQMHSFIAIDPKGLQHESHNQSEFAKEHGLRQGTISACLRGEIHKHRGWTFRLKE